MRNHSIDITEDTCWTRKGSSVVGMLSDYRWIFGVSLPERWLNTLAVSCQRFANTSLLL